VDFHDKSLRRGYHFQDHFKYTLASLGPRGAVYACRADPEAASTTDENSTAHLAHVTYKPYESWATSGSEWSITLPQGEDPIAVAAGGHPLNKQRQDMTMDDDGDEESANILNGHGYVMVATTRGYVRFFSGGGVQRYIWCVGGDVVSMAADAEWSFVVHREGGTSLDGM
jgi:chromosome transmission fidelity protein 4